MRIYILIFLLLIPFFSFSQKRDYKSYDKAAKYYFQGGKNDKAKELLYKILDETPDWKNANLLLSNIYEEESNIEEAEIFMLNAYHVKGNNIYYNEDFIKGFEKVIELLYTNGRYEKTLYYADSLVAIDTSFKEKEILIEKDLKSQAYHITIDEIIRNCNFSIDAIKNPMQINPMNMGKNINSNFKEYSPLITHDNSTFYVTRILEEYDKKLRKKEFNEDVFYATKYNNGEWSVMLPLEGINTESNEGALAISADGSMIAFGSNFANHFHTDLYVCFVKNNVWSRAYNLGKHINSGSKDTQPCFSPDGKFLYFVSSRPGGVGGLDIWRSEIIYEDEKIRFLEPDNLGEPINTKRNEMSPFIHANNLNLYFASKGHEGMGGFDIYVSKRENVDSDWNAPINLGYPINTYKTENSMFVSSDGKTAYYVSDHDGYGKEDIFYFQLPEEIQINPINDLELEIISTKKGAEVVLNNVEFLNNSYELLEDSYSELNKLVSYLIKTPEISILIEGHTDNIGSKEDNMILSKKRAKSVYYYLINSGIDNKRLDYKGYGEVVPIADNNTSKGRALNRRTSFRIIQ